MAMSCTGGKNKNGHPAGCPGKRKKIYANPASGIDFCRSQSECFAPLRDKRRFGVFVMRRGARGILAALLPAPRAADRGKGVPLSD